MIFVQLLNTHTFTLGLLLAFQCRSSILGLTDGERDSGGSVVCLRRLVLVAYVYRCFCMM